MTIDRPAVTPAPIGSVVFATGDRALSAAPFAASIERRKVTSGAARPVSHDQRFATVPRRLASRIPVVRLRSSPGRRGVIIVATCRDRGSRSAKRDVTKKARIVIGRRPDRKCAPMERGSHHSGGALGAGGRPHRGGHSPILQAAAEVLIIHAVPSCGLWPADRRAQRRSRTRSPPGAGRGRSGHAMALVYPHHRPPPGNTVPGRERHVLS